VALVDPLTVQTATNAIYMLIRWHNHFEQCSKQCVRIPSHKFLRVSLWPIHCILNVEPTLWIN